MTAVTTSEIMVASHPKETEVKTKPKVETQDKLSIDSVRLEETTSKVFEAIEKGQIIRFGNGWLTRCQKCMALIEISSKDHKTFLSKNNKNLRIAPSITCPMDKCDWTAAVVIKPEQDILSLFEETETKEEEEDNDETQDVVIG